MDAIDAQRIGPGAFADLLGFRAVADGPDGVVVEAMPLEEHLNSGGIVHGGYLAALLDSATGWAVHAQLPPGAAAPHLHLSVQYLRVALAGELLVCRGRCVKSGQRVLAAEAQVTQGDRTVATATTTHLVAS